MDGGSGDTRIFTAFVWPAWSGLCGVSGPLLFLLTLFLEAEGCLWVAGLCSVRVMVEELLLNPVSQGQVNEHLYPGWAAGCG